MNIFEKLIDELKEENLLEETVMENNGIYKSENSGQKPNATQSENTVNEVSVNEITQERSGLNTNKSSKHFPQTNETGFEIKEQTAEEYLEDFSKINFESDKELIESQDKTKDSVSFFYRRAKEEVASLQMVELILSGVERDQVKIIPNVFDDIAVKTALHKFGIAVESQDSSEHSQFEFLLMQETENWYSALSQRDKNITVGHLRRFCETTRPMLSSQALLALCRFYRNAPYSETVRSKFDLVITRLLTRESSDDKREMVFGRDEIIKHLEGLYAEWSSISLYSPDKDDSTILITALKFEDFISEANEAKEFDDLIKNDFFNRLRAVKESTSENFFAPVVTTAAIECNAVVGNRYIELLRSEDVNPESLIEKYGVLREEAISDTAGKTLQLVELLNMKGKLSEKGKQALAKDKLDAENLNLKNKQKPAIKKAKVKGLFAVNKWLVWAAIIVVLGNIILFLVSNDSITGGQTPAIVADRVNLENSILKEHLKSARISNGVFFGRVAPSWNALTQEDKEKFLQKVLVAGKERGFETAHLLNEENRPVAYAKGENIKVNELP